MANGLIPPGRRAAAGQLPGSETLQPSPNNALISLWRQMGQAFSQLGEQMAKAPDSDSLAMTRASAILRQSQSALKQLTGGQKPSDGGVDLSPQTGKPSRADGRVDPITRRTNSGQLQSGNPTTL
jgi:hypothetical protein